MNQLERLHAEIDERVRSIRSQSQDWLCRMGCDGCCRQLAEIPRLTEAEWVCLQEGLAELTPEQMRKIAQAVADLRDSSIRPIICPLLDQSTGECLVYASRPLACRTYGYYVQRGLGLYCKAIESRVAEGEYTDVVWGNQDALERRLSGCGEARELTEWFLDPVEGGRSNWRHAGFESDG